jgi:hypothetical protein
MRRLILPVLLPVLLLLLLNSAFTAQAADVSITNCTEAAFDQAVAAVVAANGGTISFNCPTSTVIPLTSQKRFTGQNAVYVIEGNNTVTLDGQNDTRVLYTAPNLNLTLTVGNLSIINGNAKNDSDSERAANQGGGIYSGYVNHLVVENVTFTNNRAKADKNEYHGGGAIALDTEGTAIILNSTFTGNRAPSGGAINNLRTTLEIRNSIFRDNEAGSATIGGGGAVYNDGGQLTIIDSWIDGNTAGSLGGGIFTFSTSYTGTQHGGKTVIKNTVISNNHANHGGGMWKGGNNGLVMKNSTVANNTAVKVGAGMSATGRGDAPSEPPYNFKIINSTITGNVVQMTGSAAGIFNSSAKSIIINSTIAYNRVPNDSASVGAGIHTGFDAGSSTTVRNSIFAHNTGGWNGVWGCMGTLNDGGNNLQYIGESCSGFKNADPLLDSTLTPALTAFVPGGVTPTHTLTSSSPAVNGGENCPSKDQRGTPRPQGDKCDIGAYELVGTAPGPFGLVSPANGSTLSTPTLTWTASTGASEYVLVIKRESSGEKIVKERLSPAALSCNTQCTVSLTGVTLNPGKTYTWKVTGKNVFGKVKGGKWSFTAG